MEIDATNIRTEKEANAIEAIIREKLKKEGTYSEEHERKINSFIPKAEKLSFVDVEAFKNDRMEQCDEEISEIDRSSENYEKIVDNIKKRYLKQVDDQRKIHFSEQMDKLTISAGLRVKI